MEFVLLKLFAVFKWLFFPIFFVFTGKHLAQYSDWFNEHYIDIASYSIGGIVIYTHPLFILSPSMMFLTSILSLACKTIVGVSVTYFINKLLKKYYPVKDETLKKQ